MKSISKAFKRAIYDDERNYLAYADITLSNGTVLALTNSEIWTGGFSCEDAVGDDNEFTALGSVIIGSAELIINNIYETYSNYDFTDAKVKLSVGMEFTEDNETWTEKIKLGVYTVDETSYNGATIKLSLLDNLEKFDRPYVTNLTYPATLDEIVRDACTKCGVTLATLNFPHKNYSVPSAPDGDSTTFREVLSYAATIAGCFVKCNEDGDIEFKWFDQTSLENYAAELDGGTFNPWSGGTAYDGGTFNPWSSGTVYDGGTLQDERGIHYIFSLYSQNIEIDDIVITGVTFSLQEDVNGEQQTYTYTSGTTGYVIEIQENPFITRDTAQTIVDWLGAQLIGLRFRKLTVTHGSDPSIEVGDVAIVIDRKQNVYRALITRSNFSVDNNQTIVCGAATPLRNSATRFSSQTKSYVEARKLVEKEKTSREAALEELAEALAAMSGLYTHIVHTQSGDIFYLHDKPNLIDSKVVWKMTAEAWGVTNDWQGTDEATTQADKWVAGMTVNGDVIARIMNVIGINFDWGTGGTLTLGGQNNTNGSLRLLDASGNSIGTLDNNGANLTGAIKLVKTIASGLSTTGIMGQFDAIVPKFQQPQTMYGLDLHNEGSNTNYLRIATYQNSSYAYNNTIHILSNVPIRIYSSINDYQNFGHSIILDEYGFAVADSSSGTAGIPSFSAGNGGFQGGGLSVSYSEGFEYNDYNLNGANFDSNVTVEDNLTVLGTKSRVVKTQDYANRLLYCYETPSPLFGDVGEGVIAEDGYCYIQIDPILAETINTNQYQVFLQKYGEGDCYVKKRCGTYFIVCGTPNMWFGWELKAKQIDYDQLRLNKQTEIVNTSNQIDYVAKAINHIQKIMHEREVVT